MREWGGMLSAEDDPRNVARVTQSATNGMRATWMKVRFEARRGGLAFFTTRIMAGRKSSAPGSSPPSATVSTRVISRLQATISSILAVGPASALMRRSRATAPSHATAAPPATPCESGQAGRGASKAPKIRPGGPRGVSHETRGG